MKNLDDLPRFGTGIGLHRVLDLDVRERISVDGEPISRQELAAAWSWLAAEIEPYEKRHPGERVGRFEALTALALRHFTARRPDAVVAEVGIGGRHDPVRLFPGGLSALVSVDLEHTELLGHTLEEIAFDKADAAAEGTTLVTGPLPADVHRKLAAYARVRRLELVAATEACRVSRAESTAGGERLDLQYGGKSWDGVDLALHGEHQAHNAAVAVVLAGRWLERHRALGQSGLESAVRQGLASVRWPCRLERIGEKPDIYVDAAHTPAAIAALVAASRRLFRGERVVLVVGVSRGRSLEDIVAPLLELACAVIVTRAKERGAPVSEVALFVRGRGGFPVETAPSVAEALELAVEEASRRGTAVLVAGGLFLAVEAHPAATSPS